MSEERKLEHIYFKCPCKDAGICKFCDGGLLYCTVCEQGEAELTEICPGRKSPCGESFVHKNIEYFAGWMRENSFGMWINEQPNGGFRWDFYDFEPKDGHEYVKVFLTARDPRSRQ